MKKISFILVLFMSIFLTACIGSEIGLKEEDLAKINIDATTTFDESKVSKKVKDIVDKNFKKNKKYLIPEKDTVFKISVSSDAKVSQETKGTLGNIGVTFLNEEYETKEDALDFAYSFAISPVSEDFSPKYLYHMYSQEYSVELYEIEGLDLVMNATDGDELVAEFTGKDNVFYVITVKSRFNPDERIYILNKILENMEK